MSWHWRRVAGVRRDQGLRSTDLPTPTIYALLWLAVLAIAEFYLAAVTRARLAGRPGTRPVDPLVVARFVALAKASSIVGSLAAGGYAGYLLWVVRIVLAGRRATTSGPQRWASASSVLLVAPQCCSSGCAGCRERDDDDDERPASAVH